MNILPKKRWHVRNKDNITRVRKDEADAEVITQKLLSQQKIAESERRVNFLRKQKGIPETKSQKNLFGEKIILENNEKTSKHPNECQQSHLNLFNDFMSHIKVGNVEHEIEKKAEIEKYEKQIGYLTYLGQDTNEALKLKNWYDVLPEREAVKSKTQEKDAKNKQKYDPLSLINSLLHIHECTDITFSTSTGIKNSFTSKSTEMTAKSKSDVNVFSESQRLGRKQHAKCAKGKVQHALQKNKHNLQDSGDILVQKRLRLEILRKERLKRELVEKERQAELLKSNTSCSNREPTKLSQSSTRINQKYSSQYYPQLAKQNMN